MKSFKVVFAAAVVAAVGFARADATTESRTAGAVVRFGVVTDLHCADLDTADHTKFVPVAGKVYYRESLGKLEKAVAALNARAVDFVIELGDFKDLTKNRAADGGCEEAEVAYAAALFKGDGVDANAEEAFRRFRIAAEKGNAAAMDNLAACYERGRGVAADERLALEWTMRDRAAKTWLERLK